MEMVTIAQAQIFFSQTHTYLSINPAESGLLYNHCLRTVETRLR